MSETWTDERGYPQWSKWWYAGPVCINLFTRLGWYVSIGLHVGFYDPWDVELHAGPFILTLMSSEQGKEIEGIESGEEEAS